MDEDMKSRTVKRFQTYDRGILEMLRKNDTGTGTEAADIRSLFPDSEVLFKKEDS